MANQQPQQQQPKKTTEKEKMTKSGAIEPIRTTLPSRWRSPFSMLKRFEREMDRMFGDFFEPGLFRWPEERLGAAPERTWWPEIEVSQKDGKFVVRADVPGLKKDDITVEVVDNELCISGERKSEYESTEGGYYRSERSYGSFCRTIPLPEGAKPESASASFENGVLTIEMEAPKQEPKGRRIEVREGHPH